VPAGVTPKKRKSLLGETGSVLYYVALVAVAAYGCLTVHQKGALDPPPFAVVAAAIGAVGFAFVSLRIFTWAKDPEVPTWEMIAVALSLLIAIVLGFSAAYYITGTTHNWTTTMSRNKAIYFAVGTLTTGAGGVAPTSHEARDIVLAQQLLDLVVLTVVVGAVIYRMTHHHTGESARAPAKPPEEPLDYGF
jgi:hypothetical protein